MDGMHNSNSDIIWDEDIRIEDTEVHPGCSAGSEPVSRDAVLGVKRPMKKAGGAMTAIMTVMRIMYLKNVWAGTYHRPAGYSAVPVWILNVIRSSTLSALNAKKKSAARWKTQIRVWFCRLPALLRRQALVLAAHPQPRLTVMTCVRMRSAVMSDRALTGSS